MPARAVGTARGQDAVDPERDQRIKRREWVADVVEGLWNVTESGRARSTARRCADVKGAVGMKQTQDNAGCPLRLNIKLIERVEKQTHYRSRGSHRRVVESRRGPDGRACARGCRFGSGRRDAAKGAVDAQLDPIHPRVRRRRPMRPISRTPRRAAATCWSSSGGNGVGDGAREVEKLDAFEVHQDGDGELAVGKRVQDRADLMRAARLPDFAAAVAAQVRFQPRPVVSVSPARVEEEVHAGAGTNAPWCKAAANFTASSAVPHRDWSLGSGGVAF